MIKDYGIVIRERRFMDSSKIITLLTKRYGKITVMSKGAMRPKSKNLCSTCLFCNSEFVLYKGKEFYYISSSNVVELFYSLRKSASNYASASYICELCDKLLIEGEEYGIIYEMMVEAFRTLERDESIWEVLVPAFQIKLASLLGYRPSLSNCVICDKRLDTANFFDHKEGGVVCEECAKEHQRIDPHSINLMKHFIMQRFKELENNAQSFKTFSILNNYIKYQFEIPTIKSYEIISRLYKRED